MATYCENSCSFGLRNVVLVSVPDCWFVFFPTSVFGVGIFFLIAHFPDLCLLVPFYSDRQVSIQNLRHSIQVDRWCYKIHVYAWAVMRRQPVLK